jgi:hypothetical protein
MLFFDHPAVRWIVLTRSQNHHLPWLRISFLGNALLIFFLFVKPVETLVRVGMLCGVGLTSHLPLRDQQQP